MSVPTLLLLAAILGAPTPTATSPYAARSPTDASNKPERFDVTDSTVAPLTRSVDGRFVVRGTLKRGPQASANGRFRLRTHTTPIDDRGAAADPQSTDRFAH